MHTKQTGVTLLELMIVVAVVAILAAIAYPSYQTQVRRSHRVDAQTALLQIQVAQERFFLQNNSYATTLGALGFTSTSEHGFYNLGLNATPTTFSATAAPVGAQAADTCGTYGVTNTGARTPTTVGCW